MGGHIEHANISVSDLDAGVRFFQTAFPEWRIRGSASGDTVRWAHLGTDDAYVCINGPVDPASVKADRQSGYGFNHIGFIADDVKGLRQRMLDAGYRDGYSPEYHEFRTRVYILDNDGIEYEFVEYHSDDPAERNQHS
ncbi:VOC family protein [Candidatus Poribacteria bacterium]|jgi:catechol 2,3-dioxygenase-like lactoylglutathione lyase family enzyme|nr:VOC family protein [Candidatus Poribacteria bacterium]MBT5534687.1 VOC family protein [Candidatus Poribacteria bacterium]MBT5711057.1 VOC family protein [Candidatus Poribacteria bacterium]MBT7101539.1 VOC family protein [Candidatus Poribacteria bacterium]MBT7809346.1 VOC family protein [Candidatus Poribacteria bacterium]